MNSPHISRISIDPADPGYRDDQRDYASHGYHRKIFSPRMRMAVLDPLKEVYGVSKRSDANESARNVADTADEMIELLLTPAQWFEGHNTAITASMTDT